MKKTIIFLGLCLIMIASVLAIEEPTISVETQFNSVDTLACSSDNVDIYCLEGQPDLKFFKYVISTKTFVDITNYNAGDDADRCVYYSVDDTFYCLDGYTTYVKITKTGTTTDLPFVPPQTGYTNNNRNWACNLRPTTDEIYCYGPEYSGPLGVPADMWMYDISANTWTWKFNETNWEGNRGRHYFTCAWKNSTALYCVGGTAGAPEHAISNITLYNPDTNINTNIQNLPEGVSNAALLWKDDVLYIFGFDNWDSPQNTMLYYNSTDNSVGYLSSTLPYPYTAYAAGFARIDNTIYLVGGYVNSTWDLPTEIIKVAWSYTPPSPPVQEQTPQETPRQGGNNAFIVQQNIQALQKQAQKEAVSQNPIEQLILNFRSWLLNLFGLEP